MLFQGWTDHETMGPWTHTRKRPSTPPVEKHGPQTCDSFECCLFSVISCLSFLFFFILVLVVHMFPCGLSLLVFEFISSLLLTLQQEISTFTLYRASDWGGYVPTTIQSISC